MKWHQGYLPVTWDDSFKTLNFEYHPLSNVDDLARWQKEGYAALNLNGEIYRWPNPMPRWCSTFDRFQDWKNVFCAIYKMKTCDALPLHRDAYISYRKKFGIEYDAMRRCIVFLEDWKSGHYFEIGGTPLLGWKAGQYVWWESNVEHYAGNFGLEDRYTLQITGHV